MMCQRMDIKNRKRKKKKPMFFSLSFSRGHVDWGREKEKKNGERETMTLT